MIERKLRNTNGKVKISLDSIRKAVKKVIKNRECKSALHEDKTDAKLTL